MIGVALAGMLLIGACGSGTGGESPGFRIATVARSTEASGTARYAGTMTDPLPIEARPSTTTFTGEIDFVNDRSSSENTFESDGKPTTSRSITVGSVIYLQESGSGSSPRWLRLGSFDDGPGFGGLPVTDASALLREIEEAGGAGTEVGAERLRGTPTVHHRYDLPAPRVPAQLLAMKTHTSDASRVDIWVDDQMRLRRYRSVGGDWHRDLEFFDFGAPVTIEPPPPEQVKDEDDESSLRVTGDWVEIDQGSTGDVEWRIFRAPGSNDGFCWAHEAEPAGRYDGFGSIQRGRPVDICVANPRPELMIPPELAAVFSADDLSSPSDGFVSVVVALADQRVLLYGAAPEPITALNLEYRGGRTRRVEPVDDRWSVVLASDEVVEKIVLETSKGRVSCPLRDVTGFACGGDGPAFDPPPDRTTSTAPTSAPRNADVPAP